MIAALAAAALLQGAAPAAAGVDVFATFQALCVAHRGDLDASVTAAEAQGWQPLPTEMLKVLPADLKDPKARVKFSEAGITFMFTGRGQFDAEGHPVKADICMVGARPADYEGLKTALASFVHVAPLASQSAADQIAYAWSDDASGRHALADVQSAAAADALKGRRATMAFVKAFQGGAILAYAVPTL